MADIANRDEGLRCLQIAKRALSEGDLEKAEKFSQKALKLYPQEEVKTFIKQLSNSKKQQEPHSNGYQQNNADDKQQASSSNNNNKNDEKNDNDNASSSKDQGTPEMRKLVSDILHKKDYYEILGISKSAKDDDIKKAYRKLALKLHPDKCKVKGAEEAFKLVSKSFACLSDPDKRAYYDRTGYESVNAAAASQGGVANMDEIDPEELFNQMFGQMFFGQGLFPNAHFRVYRGGRMYQAPWPPSTRS
eukprot:TRINITY_DN8443_c0_g2_i2.p3 TRINITY_DN8443_c0_g2~~TRINITY_DN8443_c0_g2_i2.p3  ORF type:complete len:247 (-),score=48.01 TRINITY_DN8443_c0_g2_i2:518-1258(-)